MKTLKKLVLAVAFLALSALTGLFADEWYDSSTGLTWSYSVDEGKAEITSGRSWGPAVTPQPTGALVIPATLGGHPVTSIGDHAFEGCSELTVMSIPTGVTNIGQAAFCGCSGVTVMSIPTGVTNIGSSAFYGCSGLMSVWIPWGVTNIEYYAFLGCSGLTSVTIPSTVRTIKREVFRDCTSLRSVTIGSGVTTIECDSFKNCRALSEIHISDLSAWCKIDYSRCFSSPFPNEHRLYLDDREIVNLVIPSDVTRIASYAFESCSGLASVRIPPTVTEIGDSAFEGCSGLLSVLIPASVNRIGEEAFAGCCRLASVDIPPNLTNIARDAFSDCGALTSVTIPSGVTKIGGGAFARCVGLTSVTIPSNVKIIGDWAFYECWGLKSATIPSSVIEIGEDAFEECYNIEKIYTDCGNGARLRSLFVWCAMDWNKLSIVEQGNCSNGGSGTRLPAVVPLSQRDIVGAVTLAKPAVLQGCILDASGAVVGSVELKVAKEGKTGSKVSGSATLFGAKKQTLKGATPVVLSAGPAEVTLAVAKSGTMNLRLGATADGTFAFAGTWGGYTVTSAAIGGEVTKSATFRFTGAFPAALASGAVNGDFLPEGEPVAMAGKKWTCAKAAAVKYAKDKATQQFGWIVNNGKSDPKKTNLSGLKLTYTAKTGAFKGTFSVYTLNGVKMRKTAVTVTGLVVNGIGYGTAAVKGGDPIGIIIE